MIRLLESYFAEQACLLACRLELFALDHGGRYPEKLEELFPDDVTSIPKDPFASAPLRYQATNDRYLIYSVGFDEKDDYGKIAWKGSYRRDFREGDWVWTYDIPNDAEWEERRAQALSMAKERKRLGRPLTAAEMENFHREENVEIEKESDKEKEARRKILIQRAKERLEKDRVGK